QPQNIDPVGADCSGNHLGKQDDQAVSPQGVILAWACEGRVGALPDVLAGLHVAGAGEVPARIALLGKQWHAAVDEREDSDDGGEPSQQTKAREVEASPCGGKQALHLRSFPSVATDPGAP